MLKLKFDEVKDEISRIAAIENPEVCQDEIRKLDRELGAPKIKPVKRGNFYYIYEIEYYYDTETQHSRERIIENLGRIDIEDYENNKDKISRMKKSELKSFLEQY
jgi:predicted metal-dependent hydrolase